MALIADTSGILAAMDLDEASHGAIRRVIEAESGIIYIPDLVLAETDYLLLSRVGRDAEELLLADVIDGAFTRAPVLDADLVAAKGLIQRFREPDIGLTDALTVALADRLGIDRILTLDLRHFRLFRYRGRRSFKLLPADVSK